MAMRRLKHKTTTEILWPYILKLLKGRPMYAYEIRQEIIRSYQFKPPMVTTYMVLYDLQRAGLVTTEWKEQRDGPARKYYKVTKKGEELLSEARDYFKELAAIFK